MRRGLFAILSALALPLGACGITTPHPTLLGDCEAGQPCNNQPGGGIIPSPSEAGASEAGTDASADAGMDAGADVATIDAAGD